MPGETPVLAVLPFAFAGDEAEAPLAPAGRGHLGRADVLPGAGGGLAGLGRRLANSLRTGTFCCYSPERPVAWQLAPRDESRRRAGARAR